MSKRGNAPLHSEFVEPPRGRLRTHAFAIPYSTSLPFPFLRAVPLLPARRSYRAGIFFSAREFPGNRSGRKSDYVALGTGKISSYSNLSCLRVTKEVKESNVIVHRRPIICSTKKVEFLVLFHISDFNFFKFDYAGLGSYSVSIWCCLTPTDLKVFIFTLRVPKVHLSKQLFSGKKLSVWGSQFRKFSGRYALGGPFGTPVLSFMS